jgi:hypothetical protein
MTEDSVHYWFDPSSPGWIKRRLAKREYVSGEDIARVGRSHPECLSDPVIREHTLRALEGKVRPRKGRRKQSLGRMAKVWFAGQLAQEQIRLWKDGIGDDQPVKERGGKSRSEAAYEKFGLPLGLSWRGLQNEVSSLKSNPLFGERSF